jgi:hypothetical protein
MYKEIQMASGAKSYMRKAVVICEDMHKYFTIYEETFNHIWFCTRSLWIPYIWRKFFIFFLSVKKLQQLILMILQFYDKESRYYKLFDDRKLIFLK